MPFWIQGWIEISTGEINDNTTWSPTVNISPLVDSGDEVAEILFGLSKRYRKNKDLIERPWFAERGLPTDASEFVRSEKSKNDQYRGECGGYTHASFDELMQSDFDIQEHKKSDWNLVFSILESMARDPRFTPENLRLIVWFNW